MKSHSMRFAGTARKAIQYLERPDADGVFPLAKGVLAFPLRNGRDLDPCLIPTPTIMEPQGGCLSWCPLGKSRHPSTADVHDSST